ncbi:MAG: hypothetical protein P4M11_05820 [Candidatus Pacebacteria bacterium]|nr:hypothetical protein [Candidatus Paceibacterota bacterium]
MSSQTKAILIVLALAVVLAAAYLMFFNTNGTTTAVSSGSGAPTSQAEVSFLNLSGQIEPITFDTSILSDSRFTSLVDIHTAILPEATGRKDPFAPLPNGQ